MSEFDERYTRMRRIKSYEKFINEEIIGGNLKKDEQETVIDDILLHR